MAEDVMSRTASASAALLGAKFFHKLIDLGLILILARILVPEDFAIVAMAMIFIQFTESILDIPVTQALIRAPEVPDSMLDTAFTLSLLRGLLLMLLVLGFAPIAIHVFEEPRLGPLMLFLALSPAIRGLVNPKLVMYARKLNYFPEAIIDVVAKVLTTFVAIPIALWTGSYWSLAVMAVMSAFAVMAGSYIFAPYRPRFSLKDWSTFSDMISWTTLSQIFVAANWQVDIFVLGRSVADAVVGKYSMSQTLAGAPFQVFVVPVMRPFVATFAELREITAIRGGYLTASSSVFTAVAPLLALVIILAGPIVTLLFNDAWADASLFLAVLALSGIIQLPAQPVPSVALALDRTRYNALQAFIGFSVKVPLLFFGLKYYGIPGFLAGQVIGVTAWTIAGCFVIRHLIDLPVWHQLRSLWRALAGIAMLSLVTLLLRPIIVESNALLLVLTAGLVGAAGMIAYWVTVMMLWNKSGCPEGVEQLVAGGLNKLRGHRKDDTPQTEDTNG